MSEKEGWFCPGCGKYHSPETKTCPETRNEDHGSVPSKPTKQLNG